MSQSRKQSTDSAIKQAIDEAMSGSPVLMFYKGVAMPIDLKEGRSVQDFVKFIKKSATNQIKNNRGGIQTYVKYVKAYLDAVHESVIKQSDRALELCGDELFDKNNPDLGTTAIVSAMWYLNVEILLQLKEIENDNQNGWLCIRML